MIRKESRGGRAYFRSQMYQQAVTQLDLPVLRADIVIYVIHVYQHGPGLPQNKGRTRARIVIDVLQLIFRLDHRIYT
jgi:hypothetical protein